MNKYSFTSLLTPDHESLLVAAGFHNHGHRITVADALDWIWDTFMYWVVITPSNGFKIQNVVTGDLLEIDRSQFGMSVRESLYEAIDFLTNLITD